MSRFQELKASFKRRLLTSFRKDLFGHLERKINEYGEEIVRNRKLLDLVPKRRRSVCPADVQQVLETKEEVSPEQQEWSSRLDQQDPEPPHIKEEQEELCLIQRPVEDCGGSELDRKLDRDWYPHPEMCPADVQQVLETTEEVSPEQQEWSSRLDQQDPEPPHIKEEQEEFALFQRPAGADDEDSGWSDLEVTPRSKSDDREDLCPADVQQVLETKEEVSPEQQEWSSRLDQQDPEPPHIKEEQEELCLIQRPVEDCGGSELDRKLDRDCESSQLHQSQNEENREAEPPANSSTEQMETEAGGVAHVVAQKRNLKHHVSLHTEET
ncbi:oocyte zinc finger protein XlCOF6-like protein [Lates japonicus]|uniref:Oocyte zinc finger protein XlCOF6-like protein n=1 Tax=Lates japonicus TaxID=270547 RepID=A0AAD3NQ45_LATJO|nr:oocyte zinc finger protein XlCOF6-like protein [Lates japonicus]